MVVLIAIEGVRNVDTQVISPAAIVYTGISIFASITQFVGNNTVWGIVFIVIALYFSLREILTYKFRQAELQKYTTESEKRMENLQYALLLKQCGYDVPEKYIKKKEM